jgi:tRNA(Met) cytidine acetyltransferase
LTLVLVGDPDWTQSETTAIIANQGGIKTAWLSGRLPREGSCRPLEAAYGLLGGEIDVLVYDAYGGFDPNAFGASVGALRGGGLFILLAPPLARWPQLPDPEAAKVAVHPFAADQVTGRFLRHVRDVLATAPGVTLVQQDQPTPRALDQTEIRPAAEPHGWGECRTRDQKQAVEAILRTARTRAHRPLVITSDRGRGKSSALGIAAARLIAEERHRVLVTAPRHAAVEALFGHAKRLLQQAVVQTNRLEFGGGTLEFRPPDAVGLAPSPADLLLVDEAAGIPAALLERLLRTYPRVVFATTVHGYEGTGRGFDVRFRETLNGFTPGWRRLELHAPIRWAPEDPLETFVSRALLLDAAPAADDALLDARPETCAHRRLDRDWLLANPRCLSQVFGLLVLAHYQTRPLDLRHLLDGPNIAVHVLLFERDVAATALVAMEGEFDEDLSRRVFEGRRRPRGHVLPQTLCFQAGIEDAARLSYARIVRIAVHPAARRRGLGTRLLAHLAHEVQARDVDLIGASFGATEDLLRFWGRCGYQPVHTGTRRNAASGAHAAVVLRSLTLAGGRLLGRTRLRAAERTPTLLAGPLSDLEPEIAALLLKAATPGARSDPRPSEWRELAAFASTDRPYEPALPPIDKLLRARMGEALDEGILARRERVALISKVLQHRSWPETARLLGARGRAEVVSILRRAVGRLVERFAPDR